MSHLVHRLREPAADPEGALVLNHGRGTDENDLYPLLDAFDPQRRLLALTTGGPLTGVPPGGRHWYLVRRVGYPDAETFARSYEDLCSFLDPTLAESGIGWERTVIGGFSMGAVMSYAVGLGSGRPSPAAILAFSGFVPVVEGWEPSLDGREGLPALIHHGRSDPVIPVELGRRAATLLSDGGLAVDYRETDAAHSLPPELIEPAATLVAAATSAAREQESAAG